MYDNKGIIIINATVCNHYTVYNATVNNVLYCIMRPYTEGRLYR